MESVLNLNPAGPTNAIVIADSWQNSAGIRGSNNWLYGIGSKGNDSDGVYAPAEFIPSRGERTMS